MEASIGIQKETRQLYPFRRKGKNIHSISGELTSTCKTCTAFSSVNEEKNASSSPKILTEWVRFIFQPTDLTLGNAPNTISVPSFEKNGPASTIKTLAWVVIAIAISIGLGQLS